MKGKGGKFGKNTWKVFLGRLLLPFIVICWLLGEASGLFDELYASFQQEKTWSQSSKKAMDSIEETVKKESTGNPIEPEIAAEESEPVQLNAEVVQEYIEAEPAYIIPDSDTRLLSEADLAGLTLQQLNYAKNEIYARKGRQFHSRELMDHFNSRSWYNGTIDPDLFDRQYSGTLSEVELANAALISRVEKSLNPPDGYPLDQ